MTSADTKADTNTQQRRRIRRTLWLLVTVALGFYVAFIASSVLSHRPQG